MFMYVCALCIQPGIIKFLWLWKKYETEKEEICSEMHELIVKLAEVVYILCHASWFSWYHPDSGYVLGGDTLVTHPFGRVLRGQKVICQLTHTSTLPARVQYMNDNYEGQMRQRGGAYKDDTILINSIWPRGWLVPKPSMQHWKRWEGPGIKRYTRVDIHCLGDPLPMVPLLTSTLAEDSLIIILDLPATPPTWVGVVAVPHGSHTSLVRCWEVCVILWENSRLERSVYSKESVLNTLRS